MLPSNLLKLHTLTWYIFILKILLFHEYQLFNHKMHTKNINKKEIEKFNMYASYWWNKSSTFKILHAINKIRLNYITKYNRSLYNKKILDVGCGGGILSESMAQKGAKVVGLDVSAKSLKIAQAHSIKYGLNINYILETIETHAQKKSNYYDIVTCMEVLEHVPYPDSIISSCASVVKKGGSVFFSTLNRTIQSWLLAIIGAEYIFRIIPKGTHNFQTLITPDELLDWIDVTTLTAKNITGIYYNPITNRCYINSNININYILYTIKK